jgi:hypothetical protein
MASSFWAAPSLALPAPFAPMKIKTLPGFGPRLGALRQSRALTQAELGKAAGISQRMVAYYELESAQPPGGPARGVSARAQSLRR